MAESAPLPIGTSSLVIKGDHFFLPRVMFTERMAAGNGVDFLYGPTGGPLSWPTLKPSAGFDVNGFPRFPLASFPPAESVTLPSPETTAFA
jgi:hypothetical protein